MFSALVKTRKTITKIKQFISVANGLLEGGTLTGIGGTHQLESVAQFDWNGWHTSIGINGTLGLDYAKRNPKIAEAFFYAGFIESWGSGTTRIVDELAQAKLPQPQFESELGGFRVIFYKQDANDKNIIAIREEALTKRQIEILSLLSKHGYLSTKELQDLLSEKISDRWVRKELNQLLALNKIQVQGKTTSRRWGIL